MRTVKHHHACAGCGAKTPCSGQLADNFDGEPEIICLEFHALDGTTNPKFRCEACDERVDRCDDQADAVGNV